MSEDRAPEFPCNLEAERSVLGAVLLHSVVAWAKVEPLLVPDDFHHPAHRAVFEGMVACAAAGQPIDALTVSEQMKSMDTLDRLRALNGVEFFIELQSSVFSIENVAHHARLVAAKAQRRRLIRQAQEIAAKGFGSDGDAEFLALAQSAAMAMMDARRGERVARKVDDVAKRLLAELARRTKLREKGGLAGIPCGFGKVDAATGGWRPGEYYVFGARPGVGKTAFLIQALVNAARLGTPGLMYSAEMQDIQVLERVFAAGTSIPSVMLRHGALTPDHWKALTKFASDIAKLPIEIDDDGDVTISDIRSRARAWRSKLPADRPPIVAVDFVQLIKTKSPGRTRDQEVGEVSKGLKAMGKELQVAVLALASLNRESEKRENKRPKMSDLRDSGSIESDADTICLMYREEMYDKRTKHKGVAEMIFGKNRNGPTGTVRIKWVGEFTRYEDLAPREVDEDDEEAND